MISPINSLNITLQYYKRDLAELQAKYNSLRAEHSKLVKDSVQVERDFEETKDSISKMCAGCTQKLSQACDMCPLHEVAVKFNLWG